MEREFLNFLKTTLYKFRNPVCRTHSQTIDGTINLGNIKTQNLDCCKVFYFYDQDEIKEEVLSKLKNKIEKQGDVVIFAKPQLELCLLAIFEKHHDVKLDKNTLEKKLTNHLIKNKIHNDKYKHEPHTLEKILLYLKNIVDDEKQDYTLEKFEENLEHYNSNNHLYTNLIEYINYLKMKKDN